MDDAPGVGVTQRVGDGGDNSSGLEPWRAVVTQPPTEVRAVDIIRDDVEKTVGEVGADADTAGRPPGDSCVTLVAASAWFTDVSGAPAPFPETGPTVVVFGSRGRGSSSIVSPQQGFRRVVKPTSQAGRTETRCRAASGSFRQAPQRASIRRCRGERRGEVSHGEPIPYPSPREPVVCSGKIGI